MTAILTGPTAAAQWQELVRTAAADCQQTLEEDLESYLVFLLMRFCAKPQIASAVLALEYLQGLMRSGRLHEEQLRDVGDQCLLYSGLFPLRARRRLVRMHYYVDLGRSAYQHLAERAQATWADTYDRLAADFVALRDVLQAMRELDAPGELDALALHELWGECGSRRAGQALRQRYGAGLLEPSRRRH